MSSRVELSAAASQGREEPQDGEPTMRMTVTRSSVLRLALLEGVRVLARRYRGGWAEYHRAALALYPALAELPPARAIAAAPPAASNSAKGNALL